jgi:hypothetical protein
MFHSRATSGMAKYAAMCRGVHFVIICRAWVCHFVCCMRDTFFLLRCCSVGKGDSSRGRGLRRFTVMGLWPLMACVSVVSPSDCIGFTMILLFENVVLVVHGLKQKYDYTETNWRPMLSFTTKRYGCGIICVRQSYFSNTSTRVTIFSKNL